MLCVWLQKQSWILDVPGPTRDIVHYGENTFCQMSCSKIRMTNLLPNGS
ncbi:hypothetical protein RMSM_00576 [Rhodopirellula maiorica SM1]|uniref:Uncharacterized protein n=1 Tax=Rhodopirellula maiorica SM1 TaxID=1265738 RepID=M5RT45_9BACT|nr:hypothetical protein RMSM_00576 [Rhodopirellula maiorica SM1]